MPLVHGYSKDAFVKNLRTLREEERPPKQAIAIAYSTARKALKDRGLRENEKRRQDWKRAIKTAFERPVAKKARKVRRPALTRAGRSAKKTGAGWKLVATFFYTPVSFDLARKKERRIVRAIGMKYWDQTGWGWDENREMRRCSATFLFPDRGEAIARNDALRRTGMRGIESAVKPA